MAGNNVVSYKNENGKLVEYVNGVRTGDSQSGYGWDGKNDSLNSTAQKYGASTGGTSSTVTPTYTGASSSAGSTASSTPKNWTMEELRNPNSGAATPTNNNVPGVYKDANGNWVNTTSIQRTYTTDGNGNVVLDPTKTDTWTVKNYTQDNAALQYALSQMKPGSSVEDLVRSYYNRVGSTNAAGTGKITVEDINRELDRLGLSDYNSNNLIYTAGGHYLPGGDAADLYGKWSYGDGGIVNNGNPQTGNYYHYGGQTYLMPTDGKNASPYADLSQMANLMTKHYLRDENGDYVRDAEGYPITYNNITNGDVLFGNMGMNSMIAGDEVAAAQLAGLQNYLGQYMGNATIGSAGTGIPAINAGAVASGGTGGGNYTSNSNVNNAINMINSAAGYAQATGNNSMLQSISDLMNGNLKSMQDFIALQKQQAESAAEQQAQSAYLSNLRAQNTIKDQMAAQGLGTSGAMQSAQLGLQADYGSNINTINQNLSTMLSNLSQQELQALADYYNTMTDYTYKINRDEADDAYRNRQLSLQQQQMAAEQEYRQQQLAQQAAQFAWEQQQADRDWEWKNKMNTQDVAQYAYTNGMLGSEGLANVYDNIGVLGNGFFANGFANNGLNVPSLALQNAALENAYLQSQINNKNALTAKTVATTKR